MQDYFIQKMYKFSMNLHRNNFCKQLRYCLHNNINNTIKQCNQLSNIKQENTLANDSVMFPGYKVIYKFRHVSYALVLNKAKRNCTILTGAFIPITVTVQMLDVISATDNIVVTSLNCLITLLLHTIGYLFNNAIGSICYKEDNESIIISYINYWGSRIDIKTTIDDISIYENNWDAPDFLFRKLHIQSCKPKLKLYAKYGEIVDASTFSSLFGHV